MLQWAIRNGESRVGSGESGREEFNGAESEWGRGARRRGESGASGEDEGGAEVALERARGVALAVQELGQGGAERRALAGEGAGVASEVGEDACVGGADGGEGRVRRVEHVVAACADRVTDTRMASTLTAADEGPGRDVRVATLRRDLLAGLPLGAGGP